MFMYKTTKLHKTFFLRLGEVTSFLAATPYYITMNLIYILPKLVFKTANND